MSKTFKSEHGRSLIIEPSDGHNIGLATTGRYLALKIEDAPALALAILEAAGESPLGEARWATDAKYALGEIATFRANKEAEAKERAELEAEALELLNAWLNMQEYETYSSWAEVEEFRAKMWLAVARRARELAKETP